MSRHADDVPTRSLGPLGPVVPDASAGGSAGRVAAPGVVQAARTDPPVDSIADAVLAVPGVVALHTGTYGEVATYLTGRSVGGIRVRPGVTEIHVVIAWGAPVLVTADAIRAAVAPWVDGRVDVAIEDVVEPALLYGRPRPRTAAPQPKETL